MFYIVLGRQQTWLAARLWPNGDIYTDFWDIQSNLSGSFYRSKKNNSAKFLGFFSVERNLY